MAMSATRVKALTEPGRYSDSGGLHLYVNKAGRKSWVLRITVDGRRRDIGLGGISSASATKPQPETGVPIGGTPTLRRTSMAIRILTSRSCAGLAGRWGGRVPERSIRLRTPHAKLNRVAAAMSATIALAIRSPSS